MCICLCVCVTKHYTKIHGFTKTRLSTDSQRKIRCRTIGGERGSYLWCARYKRYIQATVKILSRNVERKKGKKTNAAATNKIQKWGNKKKTESIVSNQLAFSASKLKVFYERHLYFSFFSCGNNDASPCEVFIYYRAPHYTTDRGDRTYDIIYNTFLACHQNHTKALQLQHITFSLARSRAF